MLSILLPPALVLIALGWYRMKKGYLSSLDLQCGALSALFSVLLGLWISFFMATALNDHWIARSRYVETISYVTFMGERMTQYNVSCEFESETSKFFLLFPECELDADSPKLVIDLR